MTRILACFVMFALAMTLSVSAFAETKTKDLTFVRDVQLNGTTIPAGQYKLAYDENGSTAQVKVLKGKKEVATATGQVKQLDKKASQNILMLDNTTSTPSIAEIEVGGTHTGITFGNSTAASGK